MSLLEVSAVERFAHALADPLGARADARTQDIEARTRRMSETVDAVLVKFAPVAGEGEAARGNRLRIVDGMVAMMSSCITDYAAKCEAISEGAIREAMYDAHDAMVADYYRLVALRSELDPESRGSGAPMTTPEEIDAWFDQAIGG